MNLYVASNRTKHRTDPVGDPVVRIESDRFEDDHRMDQSENVGMNIVEEVLPGTEVEHPVEMQNLKHSSARL
jgi:hypothetical protein